MPIMRTKKSILLIADAYRSAVLVGADMHQTTVALEAIRETSEEKNHFLTWDMLDRQIGQAESVQLQSLLLQLRDRFVQDICDSETARLRKEFKKDPEAGWIEWLRAYADALLHWRYQLCSALLQAEILSLASREHDTACIQRWNRYLQHNRFIECYKLFLYLAEQLVLSKDQRAKMYVYASDIQLYLYLLPENALSLLQSAEELAPAEYIVKRGWGLYWLQLSDYEKARACLQKAIEQSPDLIDSYTLMGDCFEKQNELDSAEEWYREAIKVNCGDSSGYTRLFRLCGHLDWFTKHETEMQLLLEKAILVSPSDAYDSYLEIGYVYQQNRQYDKAYAWYNKAIGLDETRLNGYLNIGYSSIEEKDYEKARTAFLKVLELAPDIFDGYWGMSWLCEQQEGWQEALSWYQQSLPLRPEWDGWIRSRIGDVLFRLKRYQESEQELLQALHTKPDNQAALDGLENIATEYYQTQKNPDAALHIYDAIRQVKGSSYEALYLNRIGNLKYYIGDYRAALDFYSKAEVADPSGAIYYSNQAWTWEKLKVPGDRLQELKNAISALKKAIALQPGDNDYATRLENLAQQKELLLKWGESILNFTPGVNFIDFNFALDLMPLIVDNQMGTGGIKSDVQILINNVRTHIQQRFGLIFPSVIFKDLPDDENGTWSIRLSEVPFLRGKIVRDERFCPTTEEILAGLSIVPVAEGTDPQTGERGYWIKQDTWSTIEDQGLPLWHLLEYPFRCFEAFLEKNLVVLVDHKQLESLLDRGISPACTWIKQSPQRMTDFVHVLKGLLSEEVAITDFDRICEVFDESMNAGTTLTGIVEKIRSLPTMLPILPGNNQQYTFYPLSLSLEAGLEQYLRRENALVYLSIDNQQWRDILELVQKKVATQKRATLLVANAELRPLVRQMICRAFPDVPVLSMQELLPELTSLIDQEIDLISTE